MFVGNFDRTIDAAGRLILPPTHRAELGETGYLAMYPDCLALWPPGAWERFVDDIVATRDTAADARAARRALLSKAEVVHPDSQGRIPVRDVLRERGGLEREVVVAGNGDHLEIWDAARWLSIQEADDAALAALVAEAGK